MNKLLAVSLALLITLATGAAQAAGFQHGYAADPDGKPLEIGIWYPSEATPKPVTLGPTTMTVAVDDVVQGNALPLIVMSHGNGGSYLGHYDTAIALADAGYIVAAVTHTGDNYADQSRSLRVMERPRHISRLIDHLLSTWNGHAAIDPERIGMFGFSSGGFTALVDIGGVPNFSKIGPMCGDHPSDFACRLIAEAGPAARLPAGAEPDSPASAAVSAPATTPATAATGTTPAAGSAHDRRIKAAVVAAPALGFTFSPTGLKNVKVPVQLWRAEDDDVLPHPRYAEAVRGALPQEPDYRVVPLAGHFDFLAPCSGALANIAPAICHSAAGFDRAAFHQTFNAAVVEFFGRTLKPR